MTAPRPAARRGASPATILALLALLVSFYLYDSGQLQQVVRNAGAALGLSAPAPGAVALGSSPAIQVFFTTPTLVYPDTPQSRRDSPLLAAVLADIAAARSSVDLAAFDLDLAAVTDALLRAQARGVAIRVVVDSENLDTPEVAERTGRLERAGVSVRFDRREPFMHDKIVIVDRAIVWMGSWNVTENDTYRNNNNMLRFASARLAADYTREFEQMLNGRFGVAKTSQTPYPQVRLGSTPVEAYFSPADGVAKHVIERLSTARQSIHFMAFSYTADEIADAMIARERAGIVVRGVMERQNATGAGAKLNRLRDAGADIVPDGNCYIMHHKVIVIDARTVITGSYNFTHSAERDNDENLVIVDDPRLAQAYLAEFERIYAQAKAPMRCK